MVYSAGSHGLPSRAAANRVLVPWRDCRVAIKEVEEAVWKVPASRFMLRKVK
jgi:hypothetical protein